MGNVAGASSVAWGGAVQLMAAVSIGSNMTFAPTTAQILWVFYPTESKGRPMLMSGQRCVRRLFSPWRNCLLRCHPPHRSAPGCLRLPQCSVSSLYLPGLHPSAIRLTAHQHLLGDHYWASSRHSRRVEEYCRLRFYRVF